MKMNVILGSIITATVGVIFVGSVLAPQIATYTAESGSLNEYAGLLGAVLVIAVVAILMVCVRLITND